jgi:AcrR family transcriptional regulator
MTATTDRPQPGRPRDARVGPAVIDATLALVGEAGLGALTTDAVAARAGVSKATLYRRWPSKQALLRDAAASIVGEIIIPDTGTLAGDVTELLRSAIRVYADDPAGRLIPALVSEMAFDPELARVIRDGFLAQRRGAVAGVLDRARERGELRPGIDRDLALDLLAGVIYYRFLITGGALDEQLVADLAPALLHGIAA